MARRELEVTFDGSGGHPLAAIINMPDGDVRGVALFAHCFTCSKDLKAPKTIAGELAKSGIAVMRFDFTGLGESGGDFAATNFSSNVGDLTKAADYLRQNYSAPKLLIGHSLGGAAVLAAANEIPELEGVATIGAPADASHVLHQFGTSLDAIRAEGEVQVELAGRPFTIRRQFVDDAEGQAMATKISALRTHLLILHAPLDETVGIDQAGLIFQAAKHPKSFVALDGADHLLSRARDSRYAATVINAWAGRFMG